MIALVDALTPEGLKIPPTLSEPYPPDGTWYGDLKPDFRYGEDVELFLKGAMRLLC